MQKKNQFQKKNLVLFYSFISFFQKRTFDSGSEEKVVRNSKVQSSSIFEQKKKSVTLGKTLLIEKMSAALVVEESTVHEQQQEDDVENQQQVVQNSSPQNANLRKMRLEEATYRIQEQDGSSTINKVVLTMNLTDSATRSLPEKVELALTQGELHQMLVSLRGMASTISSLTGE